jgi:hypothetical protein
MKRSLEITAEHFDQNAPKVGQKLPLYAEEAYQILSKITKED